MNDFAGNAEMKSRIGQLETEGVDVLILGAGLTEQAFIAIFASKALAVSLSTRRILVQGQVLRRRGLSMAASNIWKPASSGLWPSPPSSATCF